MVHIFEMSAGDDEPIEASVTVGLAPKLDQRDLECQLRLITVAESEEQRTVPRPRPWLF